MSDQTVAGVEPAANTTTDSPPEAPAEISAGGDETAHSLASHDLASDGPDQAAEAAPIAEIQSASDATIPAATEVAVETAVAAEVPASDAAVAAPGEAAADPASAEAPGVVVEPELVDVWRPGGRGDARRGQRRPPRRQHARQTRSAAPAQDSAAERAFAGESNAAPVEAAAPIEKAAAHRRRHSPQGDFRRERDDGGERRQREHRSERQGDRPERPRGERPQFAKDRSEPTKDRRDYVPRREREKQPDPDSPFAKLAALKAQLEANAKERR
jgi:ATP-dependent RNA helicase SUPV3L1/SUV3